MRKFLRRIDALFHRGRLQEELDEEMAAHREMMPADRQRQFGSTLRLSEQAADEWGFAWLDQLRQDLSYGVRSFRRSPGFALTAIAVLSLGIGVNLAEVHVFRALTHRLQVRDLDSLRRFSRVTRGGMAGNFSMPAIDFYRRYKTVLSAVIGETDVRVFHAQDSEPVYCSLVSGNYFGELGAVPFYGRLLDDRDNQPGAHPVAVLGYDYWQSRFGGDPGIVTRTIPLNNNPVQVVGIAPPEFAGIFLRPTTLWMPLAEYPYLTGDGRALVDYGMQSTVMIGRLKPGVSEGAAETEFRSLAASLRSQQPRFVEPAEWLKLDPMQALPDALPAPILLLGATAVTLVLLVLLSACANLGNMLLARSLSRQREIEIRLAIGAGRWRIIRQLLTENLLLASLASLASLLLGKLAAGLLLRMIGAPRYLRVETDWTIIAACAVLGLLATCAFGLAPAFQAVRRGPKATRARKFLVSIQVAVSCVLLILSSFFTRAIQQTLHTDAAFDYARMSVVEPGFHLHNYKPAQARQAAAELVARLRQAPGVDGAAISTFPPLRGRVWVEHTAGQALYLNAVDPAYFPMMRLPMLEGRLFGPADPDAAVVSQSAARRLWPNQSPLAKILTIAGRERTVIGVVKDSGANLIGANLTSGGDSVEVYTPVTDDQVVNASIVVHSTSNPTQITSALRSAAMLPGLVPLVYTMESNITRRLDGIRMIVKVISSLGAVASALVMIGIFGLLAFTVAQRTREIGIRMALGARRIDVLRIVLGQYTVPFGTGAALGAALAAAVAKVARYTLFGILPFEIGSFAAGLALFAAVALAASIAPARRALRIDPASALRYE